MDGSVDAAAAEALVVEVEDRDMGEVTGVLDSLAERRRIDQRLDPVGIRAVAGAGCLGLDEELALALRKGARKRHGRM